MVFRHVSSFAAMQSAVLL